MNLEIRGNRIATKVIDDNGSFHYEDIIEVNPCFVKGDLPTFMNHMLHLLENQEELLSSTPKELGL